ncbi:MAG TPA: cobalamin biosynthesis protein [Xanthobacteraceae bacterium]
MGEAMMVAGVGCRRGTSAKAIEAVIAAALVRAGLARPMLDAIAAPAAKHDEAGIVAAASALGVPLVLIAQPDLESAASRVETRSKRVMTLTGVPCVAEAAALAAGGPAACLVLARIAIGPATCALAISETASSEVAP